MSGDLVNDAMRELVRPIVPVCIQAWEESI